LGSVVTNVALDLDGETSGLVADIVGSRDDYALRNEIPGSHVPLPVKKLHPYFDDSYII
jgi:hypothetical protein